MIGKLFGKKSNDGFYLQVDETEAAAESTPAAAPVEVKPEPAAVATEAVAAEPKAKTSTSKKKKTTASQVATTSVAPPAEVPMWVQAINNAPSKNTQKEDASFAASNLLPLPASRRRPGPSMNGFLDMARQARR